MSSRNQPRPAAVATDPCPCGLGATYDDCCGRLHRGEAQAPTAERLMRARYSAHAVHDEPYLLRSWDPATRPGHIAFDDTVRWTRLEILATTGGNLLDREGTVEFVAHLDKSGTPDTHHEVSRFVRSDQRWVYLGVVGEPIA